MVLNYYKCLSLPLLNCSGGLFFQGAPHLVRDATCWQREHEWRQDIAVVTKWLAGVSPVVFHFFL